MGELCVTMAGGDGGAVGLAPCAHPTAEVANPAELLGRQRFDVGPCSADGDLVLLPPNATHGATRGATLLASPGKFSAPFCLLRSVSPKS